MWPASGEIDIVESRGNLNYKDESVQENPGGQVIESAVWTYYLAAPDLRFRNFHHLQSGFFLTIVQRHEPQKGSNQGNSSH